MTFNLRLIVLRQLSDLISEYGLDLIEVSNSEVLLRRRDYALHIVADRDGADILYFDKSAVPIEGYNLFRFLSKRRRELLLFDSQKPEVHSFEEFIESELASLGGHLRRAARDILEGTKGWIVSYGWPPITPGANVSTFL